MLCFWGCHCCYQQQYICVYYICTVTWLLAFSDKVVCHGVAFEISVTLSLEARENSSLKAYIS